MHALTNIGESFIFRRAFQGDFTMVTAIQTFNNFYPLRNSSDNAEDSKSSGPLPNENTILWVARKIFDFIGHAFQAIAAFSFVIVGGIVALPTFLVSETFLFLSKLGIKEYTIGNPSENLDENMLNEHLEELKESKKKFARLEIVAKEEEVLEISETTAKLLSGIHPEHIILKNCNLTYEMVDKIDTESHYYIKTRDNNQIDLKRKPRLAHKDLSSDKEEMVKELKDLADKKQKVTCLKISSQIPQEAQEYLNIIQPAYYIVKAPVNSLTLPTK